MFWIWLKCSRVEIKMNMYLMNYAYISDALHLNIHCEVSRRRQTENYLDMVADRAVLSSDFCILTTVSCVLCLQKKT